MRCKKCGFTFVVPKWKKKMVNRDFLVNRQKETQITDKYFEESMEAFNHNEIDIAYLCYTLRKELEEGE